MFLFRCNISFSTCYFIGSLWFLLFQQSIFAQQFIPVGARINALGNTAVTLGDAFSVFSNPATLTSLPTQTAAAFFEQRYAVAGLNSMAFAYSHPIKTSCVALGTTRFGDELLNHSRVELGFGHKIRTVSLGGGLGYQQLFVTENGMAKALTLQFGGTAEISKKLVYGAHVYNMLRAKAASESALYYPVIMKMGFSYLPINELIITTEVEKVSGLLPNFKAGLEYRLTEWFFARTAVNTAPSNGFGGIGLKFKECSLDYGVSFRSRLGFVHYLGLVYCPKSKKTR